MKDNLLLTGTIGIYYTVKGTLTGGGADCEGSSGKAGLSRRKKPG